jgi:hypothetical protein
MKVILYIKDNYRLIKKINIKNINIKEILNIALKQIKYDNNKNCLI